MKALKMECQMYYYFVRLGVIPTPQKSICKDFNCLNNVDCIKKGGGTCVFIKDGYTSKILPKPEIDLDTIEYCLVELKLEGKTYVTGSLYRAPNTNQKNFLKEYRLLLDYIHSKKQYGIIIGMDHNLDLLKNDKHHNTQEFLNINLENGLIPTINRPTRITHSTATLIDNIIVSQNFGGRYHSSILVDDMSDHLPCVTILKNFQKLRNTNITITSRDTRKGQLDKLRQSLTNYTAIDKCNRSVDNLFDDFHEYLTKEIDNNCPITTRQITVGKFRVNPWMTHGLMKSVHKTKNLYQQTLRNNATETDQLKYKKYRNILNTVKRKCRETYYHDKCTEYKRNIKKLWNLINEVIAKHNDKTSVIESLKVENIITYNRREISNHLVNISQLSDGNLQQKSSPPVIVLMII